jgi:hypothetical protein
MKSDFGDIVVEPGGLMCKADNSKYLILRKQLVKSLWLKKDFNFITSGYTKNGTDLENFTILS